MTPPVAIALAYGIVWGGVLLYLLRLRRRLRSARAEIPPAAASTAKARDTLGVR
jgi:CcmD family protein